MGSHSGCEMSRKLYKRDMEFSDTRSCSHKDDRAEIDMRGPFESVKDVVSLFVERAVGDKITENRPEILEEKVIMERFFIYLLFL